MLRVSLKSGGTTVSSDPERIGRHRQAYGQQTRAPVGRRRRARLVAVLGAIAVAIAVVLTFAVRTDPVRSRSNEPSFTLPSSPDSYVGLYPDGVPASYAGITAFTTATGVKPSLVPYYSGWLEPFQAEFARAAAKSNAIPVVQMDPTHINLRAIASGKYDAYLRSYAESVRAYRHPVIVSFGHEMNGYWYSWGNTHAAPAAFVAAWRHIVDLFRALGVRNVTWLWTINTIHKRVNVPSPDRWWPGSSYVNWVGIDGYYYNSSSTFVSIFGPTIAAVRSLTGKPILIAETAAAPEAGQAAKIADLFAGIHLYGLLGFVWFDAVHVKDWRLNSPTAIAAFRRGVQMYHMSDLRHSI
jgi:mannan endo-1,4-beta-mannosidase